MANKYSVVAVSQGVDTRVTTVVAVGSATDNAKTVQAMNKAISFYAININANDHPTVVDVTASVQPSVGDVLGNDPGAYVNMTHP